MMALLVEKAMGTTRKGMIQGSGTYGKGLRFRFCHSCIVGNSVQLVKI